MNIPMPTDTATETIEGFPLSPAQSGALRAYALGLVEVATVVVVWPEPTDLDTVSTALKTRIAAQPMFATRVYPIEEATGGLQVPNAGRVRQVTVTDRAAFDQTIAERFPIEGSEVLRCVFLESGAGLERLALLAPPHISDVDGLLRLLSDRLPAGDLSFPHFSEWCASEPAGQAGADPVPTPLGLGWSDARRPQPVVLRVAAERAGPLALTAWDAAAVGTAALSPLLQPGDDPAVCLVSFDGRLFAEFRDLAGPFRLTAPVAFDRVPMGAAAFTEALKGTLQDSLRRQTLQPSPLGPRPEVLLTVVEVPVLAECFLGADLEVGPTLATGLGLTVQLQPDRIVVSASSTMADGDELQLRALADRTLAAMVAATHASPVDVAALGGLRPPVHVPVSPGPGSIWSRLQAAIADAPDRLAHVSLQGEHTLAELDDATGRLASALAARFKPQDRILVFADRSFDAVVAMFGILRAGMTCVPVLRDFPDARIAHVAAVAQAAGAVAEPAEMARATAVLALPVLPARGHALPVRPPAEAVGSDEAYVLFTSGSTGDPKGVVVEQHSVLNLLDAWDERLYGGHSRGLRLSVNAPLAFDSSMKQVFQLAMGHTLVAVPAEVRADPQALMDFAFDQRLFALDVTPTMLKAMIAAGFGERPERMPQRVLVGGEAMDQSLWDAARAWPTCEAWNVYGPTEATVNALVARVKDHPHPVLGRPLRGVSVACVDAQGHELPVGVVGELQISGAGVARCYLGASPGDQARFSVAPNGARCYATGDQVRRLASGDFEFHGRRDDQVKVGGQRLELGEVEACLTRLPGVRAAAVLIDKSVEGDPRIVAGVVVQPPVEFEPEPGELLVTVPSGHRISSVNANETTYQYKEIFQDRIYVDDHVEYPHDAVVLDVGANIGMFSLFVASELPQARVFAFEPLAPIRERLQRNVRRYAPGVSILPCGLSDVDRVETFTYYPGYSMMSGQQAYADAAGERAVIASYLGKAAQSGDASARLLADRLDEVLDGRFEGQAHQCRLRRLSDVIDDLGLDRIDVLKIDVQRAELDVLRGIEPRHLALVRAVAMELHDDPGRQTRGRREEITGLLEAAGFIVRTSQDPLLVGTDRWNLVAHRPGAVVKGGAARFAAPPLAVQAWTPDRLRTALQLRLPAFMVPRDLRIVDRLPVTPQGKLDRRALLRLIDAPVAPSRPAESQRVVEAPAPQVPSVPQDDQDPQARLLAIWREVLRKPDLGPDDDFFTHGGDSIRAILMQSKARAAGIAVSLKALHAAPTVRALLPGTPLAPAASPQRADTPVVAGAALLAIWREVLRKPDLREDDDFFASGGDSIRAILMQSRARAAGIPVSLKDLHANPTVARLSALAMPVASDVGSTLAAVAAVTPPDAAPQGPRRWAASSMQRLMLLATMTRDDPQVFHNATTTPVHLPYDARRFEHALAETRRAHPILTAGVVDGPDGVLFHFDPTAVDGRHPHEDLRHLPAVAQEALIAERVMAERATSFDVARGMLVRFGVLERGPSWFEILVAEHHAALDGYSLNAVIREVVERYRGLQVQVTDDVAVFEEVARQERAADADAETTAFWARPWPGAAQARPVGSPRSLSQRAEMRQEHVLDSADMFPALHAHARRAGLSTKAVLFSLHVQALTEAFGRKPAQLGVVYSLRPEVEGSLAAIGNFLNVLPVPTAPESGAGLAEEGRHFDRFDREVFGHKYISHEQLAHRHGAAVGIHSVFNFIQFAEPDRGSGDVHDSERRFFAVDALMPLSVDWDLSGDRLHLGFQYDAKRLDPALVERLRAAFSKAVAGFLAQAVGTAEAGGREERIRALVWQTLSELGAGQAGEADLLVDLGLHSLQMLRVARRLMDALGTRFPLSEFLSLRHVGDIVRYCEGQGPQVRLQFVELTPPQVGAPKARIIGFQQVGVAGSIFDPWCDLLPEGVSLHALRYPDFSTLGDLSRLPFERFVDALVQALEPLSDAPLVFVGGCFGAVLAYETAHRMARRPVGMVFIGSGAPGPDATPPTYHLMSDAQLKSELVRMKSMPDHLLDSDDYLAPVFLALRGMSTLAGSYRPTLQVLPGCAVTAVWPRSDVTVGRRDMLAWSHLASGRFALVEIDGSHAVLMDDPRGVYEVSGLREWLQDMTRPAAAARRP